MNVELLVIADCPHTAAATDLLRQTLTDLGMPSQQIRTTMITDGVHARERAFPGSPTFPIDGVDPYGHQSQPAALACRLYDTPAGRRPITDATRLRHALSAAGQPRPRRLGHSAPVGGDTPLHRGLGDGVAVVIADVDDQAVADPEDLRPRRPAKVRIVPALEPLHRHPQHHRITADLRAQHLDPHTLNPQPLISRQHLPAAVAGLLGVLVPAPPHIRGQQRRQLVQITHRERRRQAGRTASIDLLATS